MNRKIALTLLALLVCMNASLMLPLNVAATDSTTVAWYHFDEGSGTTAYDSSIFGNDGTIYGAAWVPGKSGTALSFDGVDDYVSVPDAVSLDITEITIEAWVNVDVLKNYDAIAIKGYDGQENCEALSYSSGMVHCPIKFTDGTRDWLNSPIGAIAEDIWHHVAMTYQPGQWRIFIDGFLVAERTDVSKTPLTNDRPLIVGAEEDPLGGFMSGRFFNGIIDELKISNVALTALEIAQDAGLTVMPPATGCFGTVINSYQDPSAVARTWVWTGYNPTVLSYSYSWTTPNPDPEAGNHLDLTWVNPVGTNSYVIWDMGCPVLGVRVYPTQDHLGWDITTGLPNNDPDNPNDFEYHEYAIYASNDLTTWTGPLAHTAFWLEGWVMGPQAIADDAVKDYDFGGASYRYIKIVPMHDEHAEHDDYEIDAVEALELPPERTLDKRIHKKVKVIPAPVQFWREFIGGVTDIIVFDPPEIIEPVALVREYTVLHEGQEPIPLEFLTWSETEYLPWEPIDTAEEPYILPPDGIVEYDIPTVETDTAVLVRYTVAWASTPSIIETHFINEAILESKSPQVIVGQLSNFDVHNDYDEPVDNFELELYGIQPLDIVDWFPGWGTPPEIRLIPPRPDGTMPGGTEIIWMDPDHPVMPCQWEHFGLYLKPGVIAVGIKAYWTQVPSAELGDVIHTKIDVTVPLGETATVVDKLPPMVTYITGTFTVDGVPVTPTITTTSPPPPIITKISYTLMTPGTHLIEFDFKVVEAKNWEDTEVCNVVTATWFNEAGEEIETKEDVECFTIHAFEQLQKNIVQCVPTIEKVKMIPAPVQFWREFIGGVTDIIVSDPPDWPPEGVALVREYMVLHEGEDPIPLERLTWENMDGYPWEPIDTPYEPYILLPGETAEYDIPTVETDTAVLVRYTVAWATSRDVIEAHFINEAILESKSPQVIVGQLSNFDVHNDYHEPVDNFELELYGIQPTDIVDWFPGWGTPPEINPIPPSAGMPAGTEIIWMDPAHPVMPCQWEHFGLHLKPGVIATGVKAYWTQLVLQTDWPKFHYDNALSGYTTSKAPNTNATLWIYDTGSSVLASPAIVDGIVYIGDMTGMFYAIDADTGLVLWTYQTGGAIRSSAAVAGGRVYFCSGDGNIYALGGGAGGGNLIWSVNIGSQGWSSPAVHAGNVFVSSEGTGNVYCFNAVTGANVWGKFIGGYPNGPITVANGKVYSGTHGGNPTLIALNEANGAVIWQYFHPGGGFVNSNGAAVVDGDGDGSLDVYFGVTVFGGVGQAIALNEANGLVKWTYTFQPITGAGPGPKGPGWSTSTPAVHNGRVFIGSDDQNVYALDAGTGLKIWNFTTRACVWTAPAVADGKVFVTSNDHLLYALDELTGGLIWYYNTSASRLAGSPAVACGKVFIGNENGKIYAFARDVLTIKMKTDVQWTLEFEVSNPFSYTMMNVTITDRFGAEIEIDSPFPYSITHGTVSYTTQGRSQKVFLTWNVGDLLPCETARLILLVSTDINPGQGDCDYDGYVGLEDLYLLLTNYGRPADGCVGADMNEDGEIDISDLYPVLVHYGHTGVGKQEYSEPGIYELNSGATLKFIDPEQDMQLSAYTDSIYVTVLPEEDP